VVTPSASSKSISISVRLVSSSQIQVIRSLDLGVAAAAAVLDVLVGVAHHHAHGAADAQVDFGLGRLPVVLGMPPAPHHRLAGPRVEDRLDRCLEGALDAHHVGDHAVSPYSSWRFHHW
jgi:hypothetical protein